MQKGFLEIFRKTECLDVVGIFKEYLHFKSNNSLNFVGGGATDAHFEVTLKCKKGFLAIFLRTECMDVVEIFRKSILIKK